MEVKFSSHLNYTRIRRECAMFLDTQITTAFGAKPYGLFLKSLFILRDPALAWDCVEDQNVYLVG